MGKNRKKRTTNGDSTKDENGIVKLDEVNLRTASPTTRLRGVAAGAEHKLQHVAVKLRSWGEGPEGNSLAKEAADAVDAILAELGDVREQLDRLERSGFSPPRKSFTAQTSEGDHVAILDKYKPLYIDLIEPAAMTDLVVMRKNPNRGGLVLEAVKGGRVKAAAAHVVRLSQPQTV